MISPEVEQQIIALASATENEICGYIDADGSFVEVVNESSNPTDEFSFPFETLPAGAKCIIHSHTNGSHWPSAADMQHQISSGLPWGIASISPHHREVFFFGDGSPTPALIGRRFRHGVTDCYSLIRDFYKQVVNITLPEFPREWEWWLQGDTLYEEGFPQAGFTTVAKTEALPGDVVFFNIHSRTPNHAGVYLGDGLLLHHVASKQGFDPTRLSIREPLGRWSNLISKVVRHEDHSYFRQLGGAIRF